MFADIAATIARLPDDRVEQFLFDCVERRFGKAKLRASNYGFNRSLPRGYWVLAPTVWIEGEVSNGGIAQYFWNRLVDWRLMTADAIDAYDKIGAAAQATALRECVRAFEPLEETCRQLQARRPLRNKFQDKFQEWSDLWDSLHPGKDAALFDYEEVSAKFRVPWIRKNVELFVFDDQKSV